MNQNNETYYIVIVCSVCLLFFIGAIILFVQLLFRNKIKFINEKQLAKENFQKEINLTQIEIKDETLKEVARELHDNIGQLLTVIRIHCKSLQNTIQHDKLTEISRVADAALNEVRALSKTLNTDLLKTQGLVKTLQQQVQYLQKIEGINFDFEMTGTEQLIDPNHEIILYRICQEFISNSLKYAQCSLIKISLIYQIDKLVLYLSDNGRGFDMDTIQKNNGIINIINRASIIDTITEYKSKIAQGTWLQLEYKIKK